MRRAALLTILLISCGSGDDDSPAQDAGPQADGGPPDAGASADDIVLTPTSLDFGSVPFGGMASLSVSVENTSDVVVTLRDVQMGSPADPSFSVPATRPTIPAKGTLGLTVVFRPAGIGARVAELIVRTSAGNKSLMVEGIGEATPCRVSTSSLAFDNATVGTTDELTFTVTNPNVVEIATRFDPRTNVDICVHALTPPSAFCVYAFDRDVGPDGVFVMRAQETAMFGAQFSPGAVGTATGAITVACFDDAASNVEVVFEGAGVETGLVCTPGALDFAMVDVGSCTTATTSCENVASAPLIIAGWAAVDGVGPSVAFTAPESTGATLEEGDILDLPVEFCPPADGAHAGNLLVQTDQANPRIRTSTIGLTGVGRGLGD